MSRTLLPSKPHFFQPLLPGFEHEFSIPVSFFKYLKGKECKNAVLRSSAGKLWPIKIDGRRFEDGWKEFIVHHELHVGDFLVFRHEGDMIFHVTAFDPSACHREYPFFSIKDEKIEFQEQEPPPNKSTTHPASDKSKKKKHCAKASACVLERPYFDAKLTSYSAHKSRLRMPVNFARLHGLSNRCCKMIVMDEEGRSWPTMLWYKKSDGQVFIGCGWTNCRLANGLKEGDSLRFELIKHGKRPLLNMTRLQANPVSKRDWNRDDDQAGSSSTRHPNVNAISKASYSRNSQLLQKTPKEEAAKESGFRKSKKKRQHMTSLKEQAFASGIQHPFFMANVTSCSASDSKMYIPIKFARLHCLDNRRCKMILIDKESKTWPAKLWYKKSDGQVYITGGWRAFRVANDLKPGDSFIFELIGNGTRPVLKMHGLNANPKSEEEEKTYDVVQAAGSSSTGHPNFIVTVRPSYVSKLRIPTKFAKRYDLARKCSNVTLIDEGGHSWLVSIKMKRNDVYIASGWRSFVAANGVREGDVYLFELIRGGEKPILRVHGAKQDTGIKKKHYKKSTQKESLEIWEDVKPIIESENQIYDI